MESRSTTQYHEYSAVWKGCYDNKWKRKYETYTAFSILVGSVFLQWKSSLDSLGFHRIIRTTIHLIRTQNYFLQPDTHTYVLSPFENSIRQKIKAPDKGKWSREGCPIPPWWIRMIRRSNDDAIGVVLVSSLLTLNIFLNLF